MGKNKAFLELGGKRLVDIIVYELGKLFREVIVVTDVPEKMAYLPVRLAEDIYKEGEKNALRGIHAALTVASHSSCFITACDMPFLSLSLIKYMASFAREYDLVTPKLAGYYQPMFSFYNKTSLPVINEAMMQQKYKITALFEKLHTKEIHADEVNTHDPKQLSFLNINSPDIFSWAEAYIQEKERME
jgi:molybdenum cofactor guanylyltransferase